MNFNLKKKWKRLLLLLVGWYILLILMVGQIDCSLVLCAVGPGEFSLLPHCCPQTNKIPQELIMIFSIPFLIYIIWSFLS